MTLCLFASTWRGTCMSAIMRVCVCVCVRPGQSSDRWTVCSGTPPTASGPLQRPAQESSASRLFSPNSRITTWRSDSGCCPSWPPCQTLLPYPLTPSPISPLKVPKPPALNVWFLFIHVACLLPPPPCSWITFKIYCISKTLSRLPVYGNCQEAVMLVSATRHMHCLINSWAWRWKISINVCVCLCLCVHVFFLWFHICMQVAQLWRHVA